VGKASNEQLHVFFFGLLPVLDDMISDIGFIGLKYSIGTALKYWEYVAFKYWDRDRRDIFGIGTALLHMAIHKLSANGSLIPMFPCTLSSAIIIQ